MRLRKVIDAAYIAAAILVFIIGIAVYTSFQSLLEKSQWVTHTHEVIYKSERLISSIKDAETGQRGYFITGDSSYLKPYYSGLDSVYTYLAQVRSIAIDNPSQQQRIDSLEKKIQAKEAVLKYTVSLKEKHKSFAQQGILIFPRTGNRLMDEIRTIIAAIHLEENQLLAARTQSLNQTISFTKYIIYLIIVLAIFTTIFSFIHIRKQIRKNEAMEKELHAMNQEISMANEELTTYNEELTAANEELHSNNEELVITTDQLNLSHKKLKSYSEEIEDLYNNAPCGYHTTNEDTLFLNVNETELKWLGYTKEEVIGKMRLMDIISPKGIVGFQDAQASFIEKGYLNNLESQMIRKDGTVFPVLVNITSIKDDQGRFLKAHATVYDITEQKKMQQKLVESEQNYRLMADNITDMISRYQPDGTYSYVSPSSERLLGYLPEEMTGRSVFDFFHPDDVKTIKLYYLQLLALPDVSAIEHKVRGKDGKYTWFETISKAFNDPQTGKVIEVLSVSRDISLRKEYEDKLQSAYYELEKTKDELEQRVIERTEKLDQALRELQTRNHELDNYVYKVSHDLRAPLASILGLVNLTKLDNDICAIKHYLSLIENRVNKSDEFIKSVLTHSRILNSEIKLVPIDFDKMIDNCIEELKYLPTLEKVDFIVNLNKASDFYSDELRVAIIFKNLISNAIKYRNPSVQKSYVKFDIEISEQSAFIIMEDNGSGIEEIYFTRIFDMFFRGTQQSDGSGLGLYIVKQTLERIAGSIKVESKVNKGTIFKISLTNFKYDPLAIHPKEMSMS